LDSDIQKLCVSFEVDDIWRKICIWCCN
jgi:hypothetical protein